MWLERLDRPRGAVSVSSSVREMLPASSRFHPHGRKMQVFSRFIEFSAMPRLIHAAGSVLSTLWALSLSPPSSEAHLRRPVCPS